MTRLFATMLFCVLISILCKGPQDMCIKGAMWDVNGGANDLHSNNSQVVIYQVLSNLNCLTGGMTIVIVDVLKG